MFNPMGMIFTIETLEIIQGWSGNFANGGGCQRQHGWSLGYEGISKHETNRV